MPTWLLTNTTFGTWLPGEQRGSVTSMRDRREGEKHSATRREHDQTGEAYEPAMPGLKHSALQLMKGPRVLLSHQQAQSLLEPFQETASYRKSSL